MNAFTDRICQNNATYLNVGVIAQGQVSFQLVYIYFHCYQVLDLLKKLFEMHFGYKPIDRVAKAAADSKAAEAAAAAADQRKPDKDAMRTKTPPLAEDDDPYGADGWDDDDFDEPAAKKKEDPKLEGLNGKAKQEDVWDLGQDDDKQ